MKMQKYTKYLNLRDFFNFNDIIAIATAFSHFTFDNKIVSRI